ncbi:MAG: formate-dependent phosphoribosylglycinamide formyltransferase [Spirochaetota bacterium]
MISIGTPKKNSATKIVLLGSGELGKEVVIEAQRYGIHVVAIDRYADAPAMQVAHEHRVLDMLDRKALRQALEEIQPDFVVPEIEAIATELLLELEEEGFHIIPSAKAVNLTMNRKGIRKFAAEELQLQTSPYQFADTYEEFLTAVEKIGFPCVVKPIMSSSGKGQSVVKQAQDREKAWQVAQQGARGAKNSGIIVEGFIKFDYEITLLTVQHSQGISFLDPIGHLQLGGDYIESWQPQQMQPVALEKAQAMAAKVVAALEGRGVFGVEFFVKGEDVYFSEISPRPHDTGLVTLISMNHSEFSLHVRAILGLPMPRIRSYGSAASCAILAEGNSTEPVFHKINEALAIPDSALRLFGKPEIAGKRRMGVALALGDSIEEAREKAKKVAQSIEIKL